MLPSSSGTCVLLRKLWTLSYVTWRIFRSATFPQFITSPLFCYIIHKLTIGFRHWSSRATPNTPASTVYNYNSVLSVFESKFSAEFHYSKLYLRWSQWPRSLRRRFTAARLLRSWVQIPPWAWMYVVLCDVR